MVLPPELLPFAENFYRRFPEEFIALGMPGLEQVFDLRADGSRSRRILETPTEKTVEITLRRWQPPPMPPIHPSYCSAQQHGPYPPMMQHGPYPMVGGPPPAMPYPGGGVGWGQTPFGGMGMGPPPQQPAHGFAPAENSNQAHMASQLARLEAALCTMMPHVEAAAQGRAKSQELSPPGTAKRDGTPVSPLRERRGLANMRVAPPAHKHKAPSPAPPPEEPAAVQAEPVEQVSIGLTKGLAEQVEPIARRETLSPTNRMTRNANRPTINVVRMVPDADDPESPRSPGRFSAWK